MRKDPLFPRIAIIGVGLIGSSLARAIKARGLCHTLIGCEKNEDMKKRLAALRLCDDLTSDPAVAVEKADLVILCVPVGANAALARSFAPALKKGAIVSDVGSVKKSVIRDVAPHLPEDVHFVPAHPIAGTEKSGPEAGFADLFEQRYCILTPPPGTDATAISKIQTFWQACGSYVDIMDASHHDKVLAVTSHLPHLIAYTIVSTATDLEESEKAEVIKYSASGFRDFTRIAASDPVMWRDIFLQNRTAVLEMLQRFSEDLTSLQRAIRWGEGETLEQLFHKTRDIRRSVVALHQAGTFDPREPDQMDDLETRAQSDEVSLENFTKKDATPGRKP